MNGGQWITDSIGTEKCARSSRRRRRWRLASTLGVDVYTPVSDDKLRFIVNALELRVLNCWNRMTRTRCVQPRLRRSRWREQCRFQISRYRRRLNWFA